MSNIPKPILYYLATFYVLLEGFAALHWFSFIFILYAILAGGALSCVENFPQSLIIDPVDTLIAIGAFILLSLFYFGCIALFFLAFTALVKIVKGKRCNKFYLWILFMAPLIHYLIIFYFKHDDMYWWNPI